MRSAFKPHPRVRTVPRGNSLARQSMQKECDINNIMAKFQKTGLISHVNKHGGSYGEMPEAADFHEAMTLVTSSTEMFMELPSEVRDRFRNDPASFLEFVSDDENREALIEMGLIPAEDDEEDDPPPVVEPVAAAPDPAAPAAS